MADLNLKLNISSDSLEAQAGLKDVNASVLNLSDSAKMAELGIDQLGSSSDKTNQDLSSLETTTVQTDNAFVRFGNTVKDASLAGFNLLVDHAIHGLIMLTARTALFGVELKEAFSQEKVFADADRMFESTAAETEALNNQFKELVVTKIPVPLEEIAHLGKLGGSMGNARDEIASFITTSSEAALSFNEDADVLMQKLGGIKTALQLTNAELPTFTDQVKAAADSATGMSTESGIMAVLADGVGQAGREIGLAAGQTIAFSSAMLNTDGNVNNTSSSLFGLFLAFKNVNGQSAEFKNSLSRLGISAEKFAADIKANPEKAIIGLLEKLKTLSGESRIDVISGLVGQNQQKQGALLNLTNSLDLLKQQLRATSDEEVYAGKVHEAYEKKLDTADAKLQFMSNAFKELGAAIANPFLPAIKLGIDGLTSLANWFRKATENSPFLEILQKSTFLFLGLGGSIRLVTLFFSPVVSGLGMMLRGFATIAPMIVTATEAIFGYVGSLKAMAIAQLTSFTSGTAAGFSFAGMLSKVAGSARVLGVVFKELVGGAFGLIGIGITTLIVTLTYLSDKFSTVGETSAKNSEIAWAAWDVFLKNVTDGIKPLIDIFNEFSAWVSVATGGLKSQALSIGEAWDKLLQKVIPFYGTLKNVYDLLQKTDAVKKFKVDVEEQIKTNRKEGVAKAKPSGRAEDTGTDLPASTSSTEAIKAQDDLAKSIRDREIQQIRDNEAEKIRLYTNTAATQKQISDFTFQQKINTEAQIALLTTQRLTAELANTSTTTQAELLAKRTSLIEIETAISASIKNLTALEQEHRNNAIAFIKQIADVEQQRLANNTALDQLGLSGSELNEVKKRQLATDTAKLKELLANGDYAQAAELGKKTQALAFEFAKSARDNDVKAGQSSASALQAREQYNATVGLTKTALEKASQAEIQQANIAASEAEKRKYTLDEVRARIADIETATKNGTELKVTADTTQVDSAIERLKQPTSSTHTVNVVTVNSAEAHATGGLIKGKGTGTSDEIPALLSNGEYVIPADIVAKNGVAAFDAIKNGQPVQKFASGGLVGDDKLKQKVAELKKKQYEETVAVFNNPRNQIVWRMTEGASDSGSIDPNNQKRMFEQHAGDYLRANGLPHEFLEMYLKNQSAEQIINNSSSSLEDKAKAQLAIENQFTPPDTATAPTVQAQTLPISVAPPTMSTPNFPAITPPNFSPQISSASTPLSSATGKVSTVKFVAPDNQAIHGQFDSNVDVNTFFDKINTAGGVTRQ
jgi:TP901 family phage tail tape measure protein